MGRALAASKPAVGPGLSPPAWARPTNRAGSAGIRALAHHDPPAFPAAGKLNAVPEAASRPPDNEADRMFRLGGPGPRQCRTGL